MSTARRSTIRRLAMGAVVAVLLGLLVAAGAFWTTGGRWFVVRTPSMGTAAPVGTLVLTRPTTTADLHVGDVVAFRPPGARGEIYTHRVVSRTGSTFRTRGDINGIADPWVLTQHDLVGRATGIVPRIGWLMRALPMLLLGGLVIWALTRYWITPANRGPVRLFAFTALGAITAALLKPFVNVVQLASTTAADGSSRITVVSTGLLPVRLVPAAGHGSAAPVDLRTGQRGVSTLHGPARGHYELTTHLHLAWWQWIIAILVCLAPLIWTVLVGHRPLPVGRHRAADTTAAA